MGMEVGSKYIYIAIGESLVYGLHIFSFEGMMMSLWLGRHGSIRQVDLGSCHDNDPISSVMQYHAAT